MQKMKGTYRYSHFSQPVVPKTRHLRKKDTIHYSRAYDVEDVSISHSADVHLCC